MMGDLPARAGHGGTMEPLATTLAPAPPRPFSAGAVIGRSFATWLRNLVPFSVVTLLVNVPVFAIEALAPAGESVGIEGAARVVSGLANLVVTAALTYGVLQSLRGESVPLGRLLGTGFSKMGSVLLVSIAFGFIVFLGFVLLVVPGVVALCALYVAVPAVVVEDIGPGEALGRSRALTKGSRWSILAVALVVGAVTFVVAAAAGALVAFGASALPRPLPALLSTAIVALLTPLGACAAAVAYHDLRVAKEGVDTAALVKVFE
jgi:hypothetical protein